MDANVPVNLGGSTTEGRLIVLNRIGFDFWEGVPRFTVNDQAGIANLNNQLMAYCYYACTSRQPKMISAVAGSGMIPIWGY